MTKTSCNAQGLVILILFQRTWSNPINKFAQSSHGERAKVVWFWNHQSWKCVGGMGRECVRVYRWHRYRGNQRGNQSGYMKIAILANVEVWSSLSCSLQRCFNVHVTRAVIDKPNLLQFEVSAPFEVRPSWCNSYGYFESEIIGWQPS